MKALLRFILSALTVLLPAACVDTEEYSDDAFGNFEALWTIMDEHYCFFNEKGIDWDSVHAVYAKQVNNGMTQVQLFEVMGNMLGELKDGHVNLTASFDMARNWSWKDDYLVNYIDTLYRLYIGTDYLIAGSLRYRVLDDNIGYIRCESFENTLSSTSVSNALAYLMPCNGLIIDLRNNSGGKLSSAETFAAHFTNEERLVGYMQHKTGTGHNDFSEPEEQRLKPASGTRWQKGVAVLTNRSVYSAANEFVKYMKCCPQVVIVGDKTGGGAGMPFSSELPNGWSVRFSACPMYDCNMESTENGIEPDYDVSLNNTDLRKKKDTIIEYARKLLHD